MRASKKAIDRPKPDMFKMGWASVSEKAHVDDALSTFPEEWSVRKKIVELSKRYNDLIAEGSTAKTLIRRRLFEGYKSSLMEIDDFRQAEILNIISFLLTNDISQIAPDLFSEHYGFFFAQYLKDTKRDLANKEADEVFEREAKPVTGRRVIPGKRYPGLDGIIDNMKD